MKNIVVLYHKNCPDGFGGAWAAWKKLGSKADYIPVLHQESPPEGLREKRIYLVDFTYPVQILKELITHNKQVIGIDHHADRAEAIQLTHDYRFDPTRSGAVLAWQYFHPGKPTPQLLRHIEDYDLWRFSIPRTKEIVMALELIPQDFNKWNIIARDMQKARSRKKYIATGAVLTKFEKEKVRDMTENDSEEVIFEGHRTLAVNASVFIDELGGALAKKMPPIGIVWYQKKDKRKFSLRSDGAVDVSALARKFGGGGHHDAAGFKLPSTDPFPWKPIN
jgi:oligoribonuclease NrnB/cAMP/cGMP phosphodiesterase (DHH superfamily)